MVGHRDALRIDGETSRKVANSSGKRRCAVEYQGSPADGSISDGAREECAGSAVGHVFDFVVIVEHDARPIRVTPKFFHSMSPGRCWRGQFPDGIPVLVEPRFRKQIVAMRLFHAAQVGLSSSIRRSIYRCLKIQIAAVLFHDRRNLLPQLLHQALRKNRSRGKAA